MTDREFSLLEEPWILVIGTENQTRKVSLTQALLQAHQIRDLAGESKTQDSAVLRLLLAVVYTVFSKTDEQGIEAPITGIQEAVRRWGALWDCGAFPQGPIETYLTQWQDRFWLFHPERPFYQVPGLQGTENPAKKLNGVLVESSNKIQLFSLWNGERKDRLTYDEAARWLVFIQGYGDAAAKKPSPRLGWLGSIGLVEAKGKTLFETLMLNLVLWRDAVEPWEDGIPAWEAELPDEKKREIPPPYNPSELLTLQGRQILLRRKEEWVIGYVEAAGDYFEKENALFEQMTLWGEIKERGEVIGYRPKLHQPGRQMWRDFSVLMGQNVRKPGIVSWIAKLKEQKKLPKSKLIAFQIVGVQYGSMSCGIQDEFSDQLQMYSGLLEELGQRWQHHVQEEVERCDQLAGSIERLASRIDKAAGGDGSTAMRTARERFYYRLDLPFREWLLSIDPEINLREQREIRLLWREQVKRIALSLTNELVEQGGIAALVGRTVKEKVKNREETHTYCSPKAFNQFISELHRWEGTES